MFVFFRLLALVSVKKNSQVINVTNLNKVKDNESSFSAVTLPQSLKQYEAKTELEFKDLFAYRFLLQVGYNLAVKSLSCMIVIYWLRSYSQS